MLKISGSSAMPLSSVIGSGSSVGRVGVPVAESQALYAQFEHVYGVPTEGGVRINRAMVLDALIEKLSTIRKERGLPALPAEKASGIGPDMLDAAIARYQADIKEAAAAPATPYRPRPSLPSALAFDLLV